MSRTVWPWADVAETDFAICLHHVVLVLTGAFVMSISLVRRWTRPSSARLGRSSADPTPPCRGEPTGDGSDRRPGFGGTSACAREVPEEFARPGPGLPPRSSFSSGEGQLVAMTGVCRNPCLVVETASQYSHDDDEHSRRNAHELRLLFPRPAPARVLEIGCGNLDLYRYLEFDKCNRYVGVDRTERMLNVSFEPGVELVHAEGFSYRTDEEFDLILSRQVAQYWSRDQLVEHLDNACSMLSARGAIIIGGIPGPHLRLASPHCDTADGGRCSALVTLIAPANESRGKRLRARRPLLELKRLAASRGLRAGFYGSAHYPYQFHAVLQY
jgi:SAM-dependent methyltransferase